MGVLCCMEGDRYNGHERKRERKRVEMSERQWKSLRNCKDRRGGTQRVSCQRELTLFKKDGRERQCSMGWERDGRGRMYI